MKTNIKGVERDESAETGSEIVEEFLEIGVTADAIEHFHERLKLALIGNSLS
jgi:hypothetical protein